jgi:hypothetical protein
MFIGDPLHSVSRIAFVLAVSSRLAAAPNWVENPDGTLLKQDAHA